MVRSQCSHISGRASFTKKIKLLRDRQKRSLGQIAHERPCSHQILIQCRIAQDTYSSLSSHLRCIVVKSLLRQSAP